MIVEATKPSEVKITATRKSAYEYLKLEHAEMCVEMRDIKAVISNVMHQQNSMAVKGYVSESKQFEYPLSILATEQEVLADAINAVRGTMELMQRDFKNLHTHCLVHRGAFNTHLDFLPNWVETPLGRY